MNHDYRDITERIAEAPKWWDENAVPRYCDFSPEERANIYTNEVALVEVRCQGCAKLFLVCFSRSRYQTLETARSMASYIVSRELHYGDPPNIDCCPAGPTMNSIPIRVVEYWRRPRELAWQRDAALEIGIEPEWASEWTES